MSKSDLLGHSRPELVLEVTVALLGDLPPAVDGDAAGAVLAARDVGRVAPHRDYLHAVKLDVELGQVRRPLQAVRNNEPRKMGRRNQAATKRAIAMAPGWLHVINFFLPLPMLNPERSPDGSKIW